MVAKLIVTAFMLVISSASFAKDCSKEENDMMIVECHLGRYEAADKELNVVYNKAMKSLSGESKAKFKEAQKAWLKFRDASFAFVIEQNKNLRSYGNITIANYKATFVEKRVLEIKYLLAGPADAPVVW